MNRSYLRPSEQFRQLQADFQQSLLTSDRSHLERPIRDDYLSSRVTQGSQQIAFDIRSTARLSAHLADLDARGLYRFFDPDLDAYVLAVKPADDPNEEYQNFIDFEVSAHQQKREAETKLLHAGAGTLEEGDSARVNRFIAKRPQPLPTINTKSVINLYVFGLDRSSPETAEKFGLCNTQTIAGVPAEIAINRTDFLAR